VTRSAKGHRRRTFSDEQLERLRDLAERVRLSRGWSQAQMAAQLGIKQPTYSKFILGDGISGETARALADLAGESLVHLLDVGRNHDHDAYPNRARALQAAKLVGLSDYAIERLQALEVQDGQPEPSALAWFEHALALHREGMVSRVFKPTRTRH
jgi:transcriptional regulator with XRE-family HTH domain